MRLRWPSSCLVKNLLLSHFILMGEGAHLGKGKRRYPVQTLFVSWQIASSFYSPSLINRFLYSCEKYTVTQGLLGRNYCSLPLRLSCFCIVFTGLMNAE